MPAIINDEDIKTYMTGSKTVDWKKTDALAFDMDGTLWDAVDSYCEIWNHCFAKLGYPRVVTRQELIDCMGLNLREILRRLVGDDIPFTPDDFLADVAVEEERMMPQLGGRPYPGVVGGLRRLSEKYRIFLLSNCGTTGLDNLMDFLQIRPLVTDAVTYGATQRDKAENLRMLADKYRLCQLVYVGDTDGDCRQTHLAGMPFVFTSYGFGNCNDAELTVNSFDELVEIFDNIK